ncbi:MAG: hypothetical protein II752_05810 [Muribaculaceae bacterium]|nr:hypothetical protein [Muribaculaceae bacterium]
MTATTLKLQSFIFFSVSRFNVNSLVIIVIDGKVNKIFYKYDKRAGKNLSREVSYRIDVGSMPGKVQNDIVATKKAADVVNIAGKTLSLQSKMLGRRNPPPIRRLKY